MSTALCFGENFSCAKASGTQAFLIKLTKNLIFRGDCLIFDFFATTTCEGGELDTDALVAVEKNLEKLFIS